MAASSLELRLAGAQAGGEADKSRHVDAQLDLQNGSNDAQHVLPRGRHMVVVVVVVTPLPLLHLDP